MRGEVGEDIGTGRKHNSNPLNIGVIIRTTGERTEKLCLEAVEEFINIQDVTILRNISPPHAVYLQQFELMASRKYDYVMCIDADIILCKHWYSDILYMIKKNETKTWFSIIPITYDALTSKFLYRGIHIYNTEFSRLSYFFIKCSEYLFNNKNTARHINANFTSRIESNLHKYYRGLNIDMCSEKIIIGWHGFEQYNYEIFRQYAMRHYRDPNFRHPHRTPFLYTRQPYKENSSDAVVARMGWNNYQIFDYRTDGIATIKKKISDFLAKFEIDEKDDLTLSLEAFRDKYNNEQIDIAKKHIHSKLYIFYKLKLLIYKKVKQLI